LHGSGCVKASGVTFEAYSLSRAFPAMKVCYSSPIMRVARTLRSTCFWLDASGKVVDKKLAKVWRPAYAPVAPAQYFLEANTELLERVQVGDILRFDEVTE